MDLVSHRELSVAALQTTLLLYLLWLIFVLLLDDPVLIFYHLELIIKNTA